VHACWLSLVEPGYRTVQWRRLRNAVRRDGLARVIGRFVAGRARIS
jgi:hypothetical protein